MSRERCSVMWAAAVCVLSQGCANMSTLQTAETLDPGAIRVYAGGGGHMGWGRYTPYEEDGLLKGPSAVLLPLFEAGMRYGLVESLDLGVRYSLGSHLTADLKHELFKVEDATLSVGLSVGYSPTELYDEDYFMLNNAWDVALPIYASARLHDSFAIYMAARLVGRVATTLVPERERELVWRSFMTGTVGMQLGEQIGVFTEATYTHGFDTFSALQMNMGIFLEL